MADNVGDYENMAIFKNVMIVDDLFKANGHLYAGCVFRYANDDCFSATIVNGFDIMIDNGDERDDMCSFMIDTDQFRFMVDQEGIFFQYGSLSIQLGLDDTDESSDLSAFKKMFFLLISLQSKNSFDTLDQFIDNYNCQYMTQA